MKQLAVVNVHLLCKETKGITLDHKLFEESALSFTHKIIFRASRKGVEDR